VRCAACGGDIDRHEFSTSIGPDRVHAACADDRLHVWSCAYCAQLVLVENTGPWRACSDGWCCPACAAEIEVEYAGDPASPLAVPVAALGALLAEMREEGAVR